LRTPDFWFITSTIRLQEEEEEEEGASERGIGF
jgi:hypothetical protein